MYFNKACENLLLYIFKHDISRKSTETTLVVFFVVKRTKNYNAVVSRQNIRIRLRQILMFLPFSLSFLA